MSMLDAHVPQLVASQSAFGAKTALMRSTIGQAEQEALPNAWQGDTGMSYQVWQAQWSQAMTELVRAYQAMAGTHENNTLSMCARDAAEGAKWGG
jgi:uncharacterized protein YukE